MLQALGNSLSSTWLWYKGASSGVTLSPAKSGSPESAKGRSLMPASFSSRSHRLCSEEQVGRSRTAQAPPLVSCSECSKASQMAVHLDWHVVQIFARVWEPPRNGLEHFGMRAHLRGEHLTLPLSGRVANAPAAMGSRPTTRLKARDNREYPTDKLRGGYWALHFGWTRGPCTDSSAGCTLIFSRRIKRHDLYRIVAASAIIGGRGGTFRLDGEGGATSCT